MAVYAEKLFPKIKLRLQHGFNVILSGIGSKRRLLEQYCQKYLQTEAHLVIDGYVENIPLRQIINEIKDFFSFKNAQEDEIINNIRKSAIEFYIVIYSIDQLYANQRIKSFINSIISSSPTSHLLASIDHINAPLLFSTYDDSRLNLTWLDCPTYEPYKERNHVKTSLNRAFGYIQSKDQTYSLAVFTSVLNNLNTNSKKVFLKILTFYNEANIKSPKSTAQIAAQEDESGSDSEKEEDGLDFMEVEETESSEKYSFKQLFIDCLEDFLVHSEDILNIQLREFIDHKWIEKKTAKNGEDYIELLLHKNMISKVLTELEVLLE